MFVISWPASFTPASQHLAGAAHPTGFHCVPGCHVGCLACLLPHGCSTCPGSHFLHFIALCSSSRLTIEKGVQNYKCSFVQSVTPRPATASVYASLLAQSDCPATHANTQPKPATLPVGFVPHPSSGRLPSHSLRLAPQS